MIKFFRFRNYNKIIKYLSIPFIIVLIISLINVLVSIFFKNTNDFIQSINSSITSLTYIFPLVLAPFLTYGFVKKNKALSAFVSMLSVIIFESVFSSINGMECGIFEALIIGLLVPFVINVFDNYKAAVVLAVLISIVLSLGIASAFDWYSNAIYNLSQKISSSMFGSFLFGFFNGIFKLLPGENLFSKIFLEKGIGGTIIQNENIINGAKNIFLYEISKVDVSSSNISRYLSGNYIVSIFFVVGSSVSLYSNMKIDKNKSVFLFFLTLLTALSGNIVPYSIFLAFMNPILFMTYIGVSGLSYFLCSFLAVKIGYSVSGGLIEYAFYCSKCNFRDSMIFILIGFVISVMTYSLVKLIAEKFGVSADIKDALIDSDFVKNLGGIENIKSVKTTKGKIIIKLENQNIVNALALCDEKYLIDGGVVTIKFKDYDEYNEFYEKIAVLQNYI